MSMSKRRYDQVVILEGYNGEFNRVKEEECMKEQNIRNVTSEQSFQLHWQCHTECLVVNNYYYISLRYHLGFTTTILTAFNIFIRKKYWETFEFTILRIQIYS